MMIRLTRAALPLVLSAAAMAVAASPAGGQQAEATAPFAVRGGPAEAPVQLTLFCSLESEPCARLVILLGRLLHERPQAVAVTFRHAAPPERERSRAAYRIVLAAARQGKGWDALDAFYMNVSALDAVTPQGLQTELGLDEAAFAAALADDVEAVPLDEDAAEAVRLGVTTIPALFLNGTRLPDMTRYEDLLAALK